MVFVGVLVPRITERRQQQPRVMYGLADVRMRPRRCGFPIGFLLSKVATRKTEPDRLGAALAGIEEADRRRFDRPLMAVSQ
jgi:hypothetical protein